MPGEQDKIRFSQTSNTMANSPDFRKKITDFSFDNPTVEVLQFIRDDPAGVLLDHIDNHGMVNYVYRVSSADETSSVIIKYAEERMRMMPDEILSLERQVLELNCLELMESIQKGSVPTPYCLDRKHNMLAMKDMSSWALLGTQLDEQVIDLQAASSLGELFGRMHKETAKVNVTEDQWRDYLVKYDQVENKKYLRAGAIERCLDEKDELNFIPDDMLDLYRQTVTMVKEEGILQHACDLFDLQVCFIHGDCHHKSIFIKDGQVALFDFEFAFLGHPAFNIAFPFMAYIKSYIFDEAHPKGPNPAQLKEQCIQAIHNLFEAYLNVNTTIADDKTAVKELMSATTLFTGCLSIMVSVFAQLEVMVDLKPGDRNLMLDMAISMLKGYKEVETLDQLLDLATMK